MYEIAKAISRDPRKFERNAIGFGAVENMPITRRYSHLCEIDHANRLRLRKANRKWQLLAYGMLNMTSGNWSQSIHKIDGK
jgi:hypothetical protein